MRRLLALAALLVCLPLGVEAANNPPPKPQNARDTRIVSHENQRRADRKGDVKKSPMERKNDRQGKDVKRRNDRMNHQIERQNEAQNRRIDRRADDQKQRTRDMQRDMQKNNRR